MVIITNYKVKKLFNKFPDSLASSIVRNLDDILKSEDISEDSKVPF